MIGSLLVAVLLVASEESLVACKDDPDPQGCADRRDERVAQQQRWHDERARAEAQAHEDNENQEAREAAHLARCGKDLNRIDIGMRFKRVQECSGREFWLKYKDGKAAVYEADEGYVRVEGGKVTKMLAK